MVDAFQIAEDNINDDVKAVELVKLYLNRDGYRVITAYDGIEALRLARESHPDLIVLDIMLPGVDGLEICRALRAESDIPIIMLSGLHEMGDMVRGDALPIDARPEMFIDKPIEPIKLQNVINDFFKKQESS